MAPKTELQERFSLAQRRRLRDASVCPFPKETATIDREHLRALEVLCEATGGRGLPTPGGFLLDPIEIAARVPMPSSLFHWQRPLAYHPRFGVVIGDAAGNGHLHPIRHAPHPWSVSGPKVRPPVQSLGGNWQSQGGRWQELLARLFGFEDAMMCAFALWVHVGPAYASNQPLPDHWNALGPVLEGRRRDRLRSLIATLRARPRFQKAAYGFSSRDDDAFVIALGSDVLVACRDPDDLHRVLEYADSAGLPVQPEAYGAPAPWGKAAEIAEANVVHRLDATGHEPRHALLVSRDSESFLWTWQQDGKITRQSRVAPDCVPRLQHLPLPDASPRLRRHLGRHGICRASRFHDPDAIYRWLREYEPAREWRVLADIETEVGGLIMSPPWGLSAPNRIGPWLVWSDRATFAELCAVGDPESPESDDHADRPFPFLRFEGVELAVIGVDNARINSAYCVDQDGVVHYLDHEHMSLTALATSVPTMLEKDALRWELNADGHGIAKAPALAVRVAIGEDLARDLGFAVVHEASDAVSQALLTADADAELVVSGVRARSEPTTTLFTHDSERCVRVARAIRLHFPDETIRVRVTVGDPASDAHKAALDESRIDGLDFKGWYGW